MCTGRLCGGLVAFFVHPLSFTSRIRNRYGWVHLLCHEVVWDVGMSLNAALRGLFACPSHPFPFLKLIAEYSAVAGLVDPAAESPDPLLRSYPTR